MSASHISFGFKGSACTSLDTITRHTPISKLRVPVPYVIHDIKQTNLIRVLSESSDHFHP